MKIALVVQKPKLAVYADRLFLTQNANLVIQGTRTHQIKHFELSHAEIAT